MDGEVCTMKCDPVFKKKGILLYVTTRMNMESIMPSETSHSEKILHGSTYMKYQNTQTHRHKEENGGCQGLGEEGMQSCCSTAMKLQLCKMDNF